MASGWAWVAGLLGLAWAAALASNAASGDAGDGVLYPMTSYPMFSGAARTTVVRYSVEVDPGGGQEPAMLPLAQAWDGRFQLRPGLASAAGAALAASAENGCPGLQRHGHGACGGDAAQWRMPDGLAAAWSAAAQQRLGLDAPPERLTFVRERIDLASGQSMRVAVFSFPGAPGGAPP